MPYSRNKNKEKIAPWYQANGHLQTIIPSLFRRPAEVNYRRERIDTPDGDFLDLDWAYTTRASTSPAPLLLISHGLEGDSQRAYVKGMAKAFLEVGYDVLAWNFRGCSGEPNKLPRFYHSGATPDLEEVVHHCIKTHHYQHLALLGFSLGGNLSLTYAGERGSRLVPEIKSVVAISTPLDLAGSSRELSKPKNRLYELRFLRNLKRKLRQKLKQQSGAYSLEPLRKVESLWQFDDAYTAKLHGFNSAEHYYASCNSLQHLGSLRVPTLVLNARNDPFLSPTCFPDQALYTNPHLQLEYIDWGGHVGFRQANGEYYSERRAVEFVLEKSDL